MADQETLEALAVFLRGEFEEQWARVASHAILGGAIRTVINPETNRVEFEPVLWEDVWPAKPISPPNSKNPG